jgi:hypothetical protein
MLEYALITDLYLMAYDTIILTQLSAGFPYLLLRVTSHTMNI